VSKGLYKTSIGKTAETSIERDTLDVELVQMPISVDRNRLRG